MLFSNKTKSLNTFVLFTIQIILLFNGKVFASNSEFEIVSGVNPPYIIQFDGLKTKGLSAEIAIEALLSSNIKVKIRETNLPWKRAIALSNHKNILSFLFRTQEREKKYRWISPLYEENSYLITLKTKPRINNLNMLKDIKKIGVLAGGSSESILKFKGFNDKIYLCKSDFQCMELLVNEKIEVWATTSKKFKYHVKQNNNERLFNQAFVIDKSKQWIVTSLETKEEDYQELKKAMDKFMQTSRYKAILSKYE